MTAEEMAKHGITPSAYRFEGNNRIRVEWRDADAWAVIYGGLCLNQDGEWEYEPFPSSRDDGFKARCRFSLDEALRRAIEECK